MPALTKKMRNRVTARYKVNNTEAALFIMMIIHYRIKTIKPKALGRSLAASAWLGTGQKYTVECLFDKVFANPKSCVKIHELQRNVG